MLPNAMPLRYLPWPPRGYEPPGPAYGTYPFRVRFRTHFRPAFLLPSRRKWRRRSLVGEGRPVAEVVVSPLKAFAAGHSSLLGLWLAWPRSSWPRVSGDAARTLSTWSLNPPRCRPDGTAGVLWEAGRAPGPGGKAGRSGLGARRGTLRTRPRLRVRADRIRADHSLEEWAFRFFTRGCLAPLARGAVGNNLSKRRERVGGPGHQGYWCWSHQGGTRPDAGEIGRLGPLRVTVPGSSVICRACGPGVPQTEGSSSQGWVKALSPRRWVVWILAVPGVTLVWLCVSAPWPLEGEVTRADSSSLGNWGLGALSPGRN